MISPSFIVKEISQGSRLFFQPLSVDVEEIEEGSYKVSSELIKDKYIITSIDDIVKHQSNLQVNEKFNIGSAIFKCKSIDLKKIKDLTTSELTMCGMIEFEREELLTFYLNEFNIEFTPDIVESYVLLFHIEEIES